ncbi:DUF5134 domain-containing protein [Streptomyces sp. NPDC058773]|uniref:DUF5134 domain-containing protein n=1 Tax=Streptomyces sp. NPDC058773 TaxID=3346632 RepID=UPI0036CC45F0
MHGPVWVGWLLVLLGAAAGAYCLARARSGPAGQRDEARGEGLMALGMAAMAWPLAAPSWMPWLFTAAFGANGLWALVRRHPHHAVGALTMVYMALVMVAPSQRAGHAGQMGPMASMGQMGSVGGTGPMGHAVAGGVPLVTGLLLVYFTGYVLAAGVRLVPAAAPGAGAGAGEAVAGAAVAPAGAGVLQACRVAMGIGMLAMLLVL